MYNRKLLLAAAALAVAGRAHDAREAARALYLPPPSDDDRFAELLLPKPKDIGDPI